MESSLSKAHLLAAAHEAVRVGGSGLSYFPSYEIVIDELRDYRWYKADMLHPSDQAVDLIFHRLLETHFAEADDPLRSQIGRIRTAAAHRPHHASSRAALQSFATQQLARARQVVCDYPYVDLDGEIRHFDQLASAGSAEAALPSVCDSG